MTMMMIVMSCHDNDDDSDVMTMMIWKQFTHWQSQTGQSPRGWRSRRGWWWQCWPMRREYKECWPIRGRYYLTHLSIRCWPSILRLVLVSTSLGQGVTLLRQSSTPRLRPLMVSELPIPGLRKLWRSAIVKCSQIWHLGLGLISVSYMKNDSREGW